MSVTRLSWTFVLAAAALAAGVSIPAAASVAAEDEPPATKAGDNAADEKKDADEEADRYAVPKDATADELVEFMQKVQSIRVRSQAEFDEHRKKAVPAVLEAAAKVKELEKNDKKSENYRKAQFFSILVRIPDLIEGTPELGREVIAATTEMLSSKEPDEFGNVDVSIANTVARYLEYGKKYDLAEEALTSFSEVFAKAAEKNEDLKPIVESMTASLRRVSLPGNEIEIEGKTLDGKEFDWKAYSKGKVVLVDFWATWCGPCIAELPNVEDNYKKYHDKGFEVLGISLDEEREDLEAFLEKKEHKWAQLYEDGAGWKHPVAVRYGIQAIPAVILVDQQGKVVSLNARGEELGKLLEKLLGPPGSASNEKEESAADKTDDGAEK